MAIIITNCLFCRFYVVFIQLPKQKIAKLLWIASKLYIDFIQSIEIIDKKMFEAS